MTLLDLDPATRIERLVVPREASRWFGGVSTSGDCVRWDGHGHDAARVADLRAWGRGFLWVVEGERGYEPTSALACAVADKVLRRRGWRLEE